MAEYNYSTLGGVLIQQISQLYLRRSGKSPGVMTPFLFSIRWFGHIQLPLLWISLLGACYANICSRDTYFV